MELKVNIDFKDLFNLAKQLPGAEKKKLINALQKSFTKTENKSGGRELGKYGGKIWMADDFNEPLDDFEEYQK